MVLTIELNHNEIGFFFAVLIWFVIICIEIASVGDFFYINHINIVRLSVYAIQLYKNWHSSEKTSALSQPIITDVEVATLSISNTVKT